MMKKKDKKEYENCIKCGKPLSKSEIEKRVSRCENCLGKHVKKIKGIFAGIGAGVGTTAGIAIFIATRGKKGKL